MQRHCAHQSPNWRPVRRVLLCKILDGLRRNIDMSQVQRVHSLGTISVLKLHFQCLDLSCKSGNFAPTMKKRLVIIIWGSLTSKANSYRNLGVADIISNSFLLLSFMLSNKKLVLET